MRYGTVQWPEVRVLLLSILIILCAVFAGLMLHRIAMAVLRRAVKRIPGQWDEMILAQFAEPTRLLLPLFLVNLSVPLLNLPPRPAIFFGHAVGLLFILAISFLLYRAIHLAGLLLLDRYDLNAADNLAARKAVTQVKVAERIFKSILVVGTAACMLMTFQEVRQIGVSILASAGIAGVVIGFAAQKSLGALMAGLQIALTQPIRVDDVVIVEGEWGRIEEITLTFVILRIWDERRLVVPVSYFIEKPFQNWTRTSSALLGTVILRMDFSAPLEACRDRLRMLLESSDLWDKKVCGMQVTDSDARSMEVRFLMSADSASKAWDLRCLVREGMIRFLQEEHPGALPRIRAVVDGSDSPLKPVAHPAAIANGAGASGVARS